MKLLVIQTAFLGDCVLTLPLINTLKENLNCVITVVCRPSTAEIFRSCKAVEHVIEFDKRGVDKGPVGLIKLIIHLKRIQYDVSIMPQRSFRSGLISLLTSIPKRIGFKRGGAKLFLTDALDYEWDKHDVERLLSLAGPLGCDNIIREFKLIPDKNLYSDYAQKVHSTRKRPLGICPQSKWDTKCWPKEDYLKLIERLSGEFMPVIIGEWEEDWKLQNVDMLNLTGKTSLKDLISLIDNLEAVVSNDSGVMHIAAALNKPVVAIFGATIPEMGFAPYGDMHKIVEADNVKCRPCGLHGPKKCPKGHFKCMVDIPVDRVEAALREALN